MSTTAKLTETLDRLSRSRLQWISVVGIILLVGLPTGVPLVMELAAAAQFLLFLALQSGEHPVLARLNAQ
ncbi:MAG TPA: hypothetical protein VJQ54_10305 [Candidatus Sulfotelmatobacter sp.]|nr:hypothetical protein [Candidatus Sulfotelmatobacter sp.]